MEEIRCQFHQHSLYSFYICRSQKDWQQDCLFYTFGISVRKSCKWNVDEIEPRSPVLGRCYMICRNNEVSSSTNFHKQLFLYESVLRSFPLFTVWLCNFLDRRILAQKLLAKCWWYWLKESNKIAIQLKIGREIKGNKYILTISLCFSGSLVPIFNKSNASSTSSNSFLH